MGYKDAFISFVSKLPGLKLTRIASKCPECRRKTLWLGDQKPVSFLLNWNVERKWVLGPMVTTTSAYTRIISENPGDRLGKAS